jgi:ligand-binding sensor domain-containing protein
MTCLLTFLKTRLNYILVDAGSLAMSPLLKIACLTILVIFVPLGVMPVGSQTHDIRIERITMAQGLSHGSIVAIFQDHKGFLWVGTQDGLNKYDGCGFQIFRHDHLDSTSLSNNSITHIYEDHTKTLWIGTRDGLNRFDRSRERFVRYKHDPDNPRSLSGDIVTCIYEDRLGTLWIGTGGLNRFHRETETFTRYPPDPGHPAFSVISISEDPGGILWLGTYSHGLKRFDPVAKTYRHYLHDKNNPNSIIRVRPEISVCGPRF